MARDHDRLRGWILAGTWTLALVQLLTVTPNALFTFLDPTSPELYVLTAAYLAIRLPMGIASDYLGSPTRYFFKQMIVIAFGSLATPWRAPTSLVESWQSFAAVGLTVLLLVHAFMTWRGSERRTQRDVRLAL